MENVSNYMRNSDHNVYKWDNLMNNYYNEAV